MSEKKLEEMIEDYQTTTLPYLLPHLQDLIDELIKDRVRLKNIIKVADRIILKTNIGETK